MVWSILRRAITLVMLVAAAGLVGLGVAVHSGNLHLQPVLSGSMRPTFAPGALAITQRVPTSSLKVGDVITFFPPGDTSEARIHRIVTLRHDHGAIVVTTKGDANNVADPWQAALQGTSAYRYVTAIPLAGYLPVWTGQAGRRAILIVLGVLVALIAVQELRKPAGAGPESDHERHKVAVEI